MSAKRFVEKKLEKTPFILLTSTRSDKYDRYLADVWIPGKEGSPTYSPAGSLVIPALANNQRSPTGRVSPSSGGKAGIQQVSTYLNQLLIEEGFATRVQ